MTAAEGLILVAQLQEAGSRYWVRAANGAAELIPVKSFKLLLSNLRTEERRFLKGMMMKLYSKHLLTLVLLCCEDDEEVSRCLNITQSVPQPREGSDVLDSA